MVQLIKGLTPEIVAQELILDGTGKNFRPLRERFYPTQMIIDKVYEYKHNPGHPAWGAIEKIVFEEAKVNEEETFKNWTISNHPTQGLKRKVFLTSLVVNKKQVIVRFVVKHFNQDNTPATFDDLKVTRTGTDAVIVTRPDGSQVGERTYWDELTNAGYTPYQLLDQRVPELDAEGKFNSYE